MSLYDKRTSKRWDNIAWDSRKLHDKVQSVYRDCHVSSRHHSLYFCFSPNRIHFTTSSNNKQAGRQTGGQASEVDTAIVIVDIVIIVVITIIVVRVRFFVVLVVDVVVAVLHRLAWKDPVRLLLLSFSLVFLCVSFVKKVSNCKNWYS